MCHSLFNHLYETRLLFLKALNDEFTATVGNEAMPDLSPITINHLFYECISKNLTFQEFGYQYVKEYTRSTSHVVNS
jgi:hypothetical protein